MEISDQTFRKEEIKRTFRSYVSMIERCCFPDPRHEEGTTNDENVHNSVRRRQR